MAVIISARDVHKAFGAKTLLDGAALTIADGDRIGVVGVNGTGKSTLLRILAGLDSVDSGVLERRRDSDIAYLAQEPALDPAHTPREIVASGLAAWRQAKTRHADLSARISAGAHDLIEAQAEAAHAVERLGGWERDHVVTSMLAQLGVREPDRAVGAMSGGERRRVALAQILVAEPALAILDEPTNHLDTETIEWLETYLRETFKGAVLMVTHDRYALDAVCNRIAEIDHGQLYEYRGNYSDFVEAKTERLAHDARVEGNRLNFLRREVEWLRRGPKARTTKQKARIQRAEVALAVDAPKVGATVALAGNAQRLGNTILDLRNVSAAIGGRVLFSDLTLHMVSGQRIGIIGKNGVGKTTLLKLVAGDEAPSAGEVVLGTQTKIAYFDQARAGLREEWSVFDNVAEREGAERTGGIMVELQTHTVPLRSYLERFLFSSADQRQKVSSLSGGERARVALAKALKSGANLLLLDEPTNDLDIATLGALEELLETWPGCALVVSHDRYFLNRVTTDLLVFEGERLVHYAGNYETYLALRPEPESAPLLASPAAVKPPAVAVAKIDKLTYGEKKELDGLLDRVSAAESRAAALEKALADPALYATRGGEVKTLQAQLAAAQAEVVALTARWEALAARA
jgi:ATP-binding cassette subfamily F protein uup